MKFEHLQGSIVAMVTPFHEDGSVNFEVLTQLLERQIAAGTDGILTLGTTGEYSTMSHEEDAAVVAHTIKVVGGRVPVIVGSGSNCTATQIEKSIQYQNMGADALLLISPYYNKANTEGMYRHFAETADAVHIPCILYNVPGRTGCSIPVSVVERLSKHPNIVGIKDTIPGMDHTRELIKVVKSQIPGFEVYSGFDDNFAHNIMAGGDGCIAALSNVVPEICAAWVKAFRDNDLAGIAKGQQSIDRLMDLYAIRDPFLPVLKEACRLRGIAASSTGTFPMPNATVEDDARILALLHREGV